MKWSAGCLWSSFWSCHLRVSWKRTNISIDVAGGGTKNWRRPLAEVLSAEVRNEDVWLTLRCQRGRCLELRPTSLLYTSSISKRDVSEPRSYLYLGEASVQLVFQWLAFRQVICYSRLRVTKILNRSRIRILWAKAESAAEYINIYIDIKLLAAPCLC